MRQRKKAVETELKCIPQKIKCGLIEILTDCHANEAICDAICTLLHLSVEMQAFFGESVNDENKKETKHLREKNEKKKNENATAKGLISML